MKKTIIKRYSFIFIFAFALSFLYYWLTNDQLPWIAAGILGILGFWLSSIIFPTPKVNEEENKEQ